MITSPCRQCLPHHNSSPDRQLCTYTQLTSHAIVQASSHGHHNYAPPTAPLRYNLTNAMLELFGRGPEVDLAESLIRPRDNTLDMPLATYHTFTYDNFGDGMWDVWFRNTPAGEREAVLHQLLHHPQAHLRRQALRLLGRAVQPLPKDMFDRSQAVPILTTIVLLVFSGSWLRSRSSNKRPDMLHRAASALLWLVATAIVAICGFVLVINSICAVHFFLDTIS